MTACPTCGHRRRTDVRTALRSRIDALGPEWAAVRVGASRWYVHKLRARYPDVDWRATRSLLADVWTIEARRPT